jgi:ComF family protein
LAKRGLAAGIDLVFPTNCACCLTPLETSAAGTLCPDCIAEFCETGSACLRCGSPLPADLATSDCPRCKDQRFHMAGVTRLGLYEGLLRTAVLRIKEPRDRGLAMALGDLLADTRAAELSAWRLDAVVPVPMHWSRRIWRGTNGPATIAERVAARLRIPMAPHLLGRRRRTIPQASLSRRRRMANVRGAFRAARHRDLGGSRLLVVDDIMTTGATVNEAAKTLAQAGADFVGVAVVARATGLV